MLNQVIQTESGYVRGIRGGNPLYTVFKGIPYAQAPTGHLRWRAPQPREPWDGILDACEYGPISIQTVRKDEGFYGKEFFQYTEPRDEDCLRLNIWTPAASPEDRLPVLFWIHGGGFFGGSGSEPEFDGEGFCKRGVILVTINYRLGPLGFLAHPELSAESAYHTSGNYGILDQIAALKWVRRNIAAFGGDPDCITIDGQSAGGGSVCCLINSPLAKGEFRRAVIQSGLGAAREVPDVPVDAYRALRESWGVRYMESLGCSGIEEMRALPAETFAIGMSDLLGEIRFNPYCDGYVLPENALDSIHAGHTTNADYMVGYTSEEGAGPGGYDMVPGMIRGVRDFVTSMGSIGRKTWVYVFTRDIPGECGGAFHAGELWYQFATLERCWRPMTGKDYDVSLQMADYWANFVKSGDPNGPGLPEWTPARGPEDAWMEIGEHTGMTRISEE